MRVSNSPKTWRKASRSQNSTECVEVALEPTEVGVRDTKDRAGGELAVDSQAWRAAIARFQQD